MDNSKNAITGVVGRGTAWKISSTILMKGVGFLYLFVVLNHLTVFEYGVAELILTAVPLLSLFLLPGLSTTVIADMGRERAAGNVSRMKGLLASYFKLQVLLAVVAWAIVFFGAQSLAVWYGKGSTALFFQIVSFSFLLSPLRSTAQTIQSVYFAFGQQSVYSFIEEVFKLVLIGCLFFVFNARIGGLLAAVVLSQAIALAFMVRPLFEIDKAFWRTPGERLPPLHFLYHHGKWGVFSNYAGTVSNSIRPWILNFFLGPQAVGLFAVAQGLVGHTGSLMPLDQVTAPMFPQFVHQKEHLYRLAAKAIKYEFLGYLAIGAAAAIAAPFVIGWFFPQYDAAVPLFQVWLLVLIPSAFDAILKPVFVAMRAQRNLFFASLYKLALVLVLMPLFIYFFGLFGAIYSLVLVQVLYTFERYRSLRKLLPDFVLRWRDFVSLDEDDRFILNRVFGVVRGVFTKK